MSEHRSKHNPKHDPEKKKHVPIAFVACRQASAMSPGSAGGQENI